MSLLNTFAILFETDAKDAKEDIEDLSGALGDAEGAAKGTEVGLNGMGGAADEGALSVGVLTKSMIGLAAAYVSFDAIASGIFDNALAIDRVGKFSQVLGESIVEIDAWGAAVERNGGSAEAFRGSVESLNTSLADIKISGGGEVVNTLAMMGVRATTAGGQVKSAFDVLPQLADSFQRMSTAQSFSFGRKLGLDQGTILLLQQGRAAVDDLVQRQKLLGGVTEEGYDAAAKFNDQWDDTKRMFNGLWMSANTTILPALTSVLELLEDGVMWVKENQTLVEGFFIGVAGYITVAYLPAITAAAVATLTAVSPFIAIGAAIAAVGVAIAVVYEDFQNWSKGAPSLLGEILGPFTEFRDSMIEYFDEISKRWDDLVGSITKTGEALGGFLYDVFGDDEEDTSQPTTRNPRGGRGAYDYTSNNEKAKNFVSSYNRSPLNNVGAGSFDNRSTNVQTNNNVNIGGSTIDARGMTPEQAQKVLSVGLSEGVESAIGQIDTGVDR